MVIDSKKLAFELIDGLEFLKGENPNKDLIRGYRFAWLKIAGVLKDSDPEGYAKLYDLLEKKGYYK